jgi:glycosyltransferase involved in cell wall biosynthesis
LLSQSFRDFELILVDDASTDETACVLQRYTDPRLRVMVNAENLGLTASLVRAMSQAQGEYLARLDSNDLATPDRFARQVAYLDSHPEVGLLSGAWETIDAQGQTLTGYGYAYHQPADHERLVWELQWTNPIAHITVMMRHSVLQQYGLGYRPEYGHAEDYDLWVQLAQHTRLVRLPEVFAVRRLLTQGISFTKLADQAPIMHRIAARHIEHLLGFVPDSQALWTILDAVHRPENTHHAYAQAAQLVVNAYEHFRKENYRPDIRGEAVGLILRLWGRASGHPQRRALWWALRRVSRREFFSLTHLRRWWG